MFHMYYRVILNNGNFIAENVNTYEIHTLLYGALKIICTA